MNDQIKFKQNTLDSLAKYYYASSFRGEMGSAAYDKALQEWINQQTGGLLEEQASKLSMDPETILALVSTIYFRTKWDGEFSESNTKQDTFHADNGDVTCDFMHQSNTNTYYWSERFSAAAKKLEGSGYMWFIRPDEGITPEELLADEHTMEFLLSSGEKAESKFLMVNLAVPKFDVASDMELKKDLMNLGITDIFDPETADFSPMTDDTAAYLSQAKHAVDVYKRQVNGVMSSLFQLSAYLLLMPLLVILASNLLFEELDNDTLKNLVTVPVNRTKLVLSKMLVLLLFAVGFMAVGGLVNLAVLLFQGWEPVGFWTLFGVGIEEGLIMWVGALPCILLVVLLNKNYIVSVVITFFYTIANYILSMNDMFLTQPFGLNIGTLFPGPLAFRWTFQFYDQSQTSAELADLLERVSPYFLNGVQVFGVIIVEAIVFLALIAFVYRRQEI